MNKYCRAPKNKGDGKQETTQEENVVGDVLHNVLIIALDNTSDNWVVDLGASCQGTPRRKFFHDYVPCDFGHVLLGEDEPCKIVGMVKVHIKLNNGYEWMLKYVRHIPDMNRNMISIGQLGDSGCLSTIRKTWWKITKGALVIEKGDRIGMLYLCPNNIDYSIFIDPTKIGAALWHHGLGCQDY